MTRGERRRRTHNIVQKRLKEMDVWGMFVHLESSPVCPPRSVRLGRNYTEDEIRVAKLRLIGMCKKKKPLDCGHAHCWMCSNAEWARGPRRQTIRSDLNFREMIDAASYEGGFSEGNGSCQTST